MKFLYTSDTHARGKNSRSRLGDYFSDWLQKIDEMIFLALMEECNFILIGGDLFDSPNVSNTVIDEFVDRIEKANILCYVVPGNHDEISHNWDLSKNTALAHIFRRSKKIKFFDEMELDGVLGGKSCYIKGIPYYHTIEDDIRDNGLMTDSKADFKIVAPHAFISIKPFRDDVAHIQAKDIKCNYDLVLCSHFHMNWGIKEVNGVKYLNMGAFGRLSITDAKQTPSVAIIDTISQEIEILELKSAKKGSEIFDLTKYEELKANKKDIKEFIDSLRDVDLQSMDLGQQIVKIGKEQDIPKVVIDHMLNTMEEINE